MTKSHQQSFRLPDELLARIDAYAEQLGAAHHLRVSRNGAAHSLLTRALDALDAAGDVRSPLKAEQVNPDAGKDDRAIGFRP